MTLSETLPPCKVKPREGLGQGSQQATTPAPGDESFRPEEGMCPDCPPQRALPQHPQKDGITCSMAGHGQDQSCQGAAPPPRPGLICGSPGWMALVGRVLSHCSSPCHVLSTFQIPSLWPSDSRSIRVRIPVSLSHMGDLAPTHQVI